MNVNSSTIIVQVPCGHCHKTSSQPFTLPAIAVGPLLFLYSRLFCSVDFFYFICFFAVHTRTGLQLTIAVSMTGRQTLPNVFGDVILRRPLRTRFSALRSSVSTACEHSMQSCSGGKWASRCVTARGEASLFGDSVTPPAERAKVDEDELSLFFKFNSECS